MKFGGRWGKKLHNFTPKVSRRIQRVLLTVRTNFHVKLSGWLTLHNATYDFKRIPAHLSEFTNNSRVYFHLSNEVVAQGVLLKFYLWGLRLAELKVCDWSNCGGLTKFWIVKNCWNFTEIILFWSWHNRHRILHLATLASGNDEPRKLWQNYL